MKFAIPRSAVHAVAEWNDFFRNKKREGGFEMKFMNEYNDIYFSNQLTLSKDTLFLKTYTKTINTDIYIPIDDDVITNFYNLINSDHFPAFDWIPLNSGCHM